MSSVLSPNSRQISIDEQVYQVEILRRVYLDEAATRIVIASFIVNDTARDILRVCIESIRKFTTEDVEIWVVDNASDEQYVSWLTQFDDKLNLVLNRTEPINPLRKPPGVVQRVRRFLAASNLPARQLHDGSYANAIALELGRLCIAPSSHTVFTMHSDTLVTKHGWLSYLKSKLTEKVRAVAFARDKIRVHALHIAGLLLDYTLFDALQMSFLPNMRQERYPDMPEYDVGDKITLQLRAHGLGTFVVPNTYNNPELSTRLTSASPFTQMSPCDLCFDDDWDVFYMHMGRGTVKSTDMYKRAGKIYPKQWVEFAEKHLLR
jgi:small nuclear ribonucleoprotein (snRNP)-like protein